MSSKKTLESKESEFLQINSLSPISIITEVGLVQNTFQLEVGKVILPPTSGQMNTRSGKSLPSNLWTNVFILKEVTLS